MKSRTVEFTQDTLNVRLNARLSASVTVALNWGPVTRKMVAEQLLSRIEEGGAHFIESLIDVIEIDGLVHDHGAELVTVA